MLSQIQTSTILKERYRLTHIVGQGGMGKVYRAEDLRLPGRLCAVKEIQLDPNIPSKTRNQLQEQFLREASILAQLDHPNLPKVSDYFTENERDYLVMDFVAGEDLSQLLAESLSQGELLDEEMVLDWGLQIIDAVAYLHQQETPVLHRDIKPANIKLTPDNRIKLVDFGLVKVMASDDIRTITVVQGRGTAIYTPLEQYGGETDHTDVRTDIYALGATLYHLLTGQQPPSAKERFLHPKYLRPARELNPRIPREVANAILWAMDMHPDERPDNVNIFHQALLGQNQRPTRDNIANASPPLLEALLTNQSIILVAIVLFFLAILLTFL
jgi:serine/threonine-protein kinase